MRYYFLKSFQTLKSYDFHKHWVGVIIFLYSGQTYHNTFLIIHTFAIFAPVLLSFSWMWSKETWPYPQAWSPAGSCLKQNTLLLIQRSSPSRVGCDGLRTSKRFAKGMQVRKYAFLVLSCSYFHKVSLQNCKFSNQIEPWWKQLQMKTNNGHLFEISDSMYPGYLLLIRKSLLVLLFSEDCLNWDHLIASI